MIVAPSNPTSAAAGSSLAPASPRAVWYPDNGDGTYRNPVVFADYSDPDAVRVGDDYWMTASSFGHVPGLPILHSRDLVNWTLVNHALTRLVPADHFATPRHGGGVWAPAIRYHAGRYWIYYPDPDFGIYVVTAEDPRGAWSAPRLVRGGRGLIDPCPFWDADGQAYLVHGWAKSRSGVCNRLTLHRLTPDGFATVDEGTLIIDADQMPGWHTLEGPKLYRRDGYYYIFAPAGGVATGVQAVFRSRSIFGPYEARVVLEQGGTPVNGPHQGAWVDTPTGEHWFLHFQDRGPYGRIVHLQPMRWENDGWPRMGRSTAKGAGEPVLVHAKPAGGQASPAVPPTSDEFFGPTLGRQWQWQANPGTGWATLKTPRGLRLAAVPMSPDATLWSAAHLLMQKFPGPAFSVTTRLDLSGGVAPESSGLIVFGYSYAWIGFRRTTTGVALVHRTCVAANEGGREVDVAVIPAGARTVHLRVTVTEEARCTFAYSFDGLAYTPVGPVFQATVSRWVGAKVGLFARAAETDAPGAHAEFDWFRVTP